MFYPLCCKIFINGWIVYKKFIFLLKMENSLIIENDPLESNVNAKNALKNKKEDKHLIERFSGLLKKGSDSW